MYLAYLLCDHKSIIVITNLQIVTYFIKI